ncbi:hypothetical protein TP38_21980, partial [Xanthomonas citri pv. citri]
MKMFSAAVIAMSALCVTQAHAQQQPVSTGLGECVDFVIFASSTLTGQVNGTTFPFVYGPATEVSPHFFLRDQALGGPGG